MAGLWVCLTVALSLAVLSSSAMLDGGSVTINSKDPSVQAAATFAITAYNEQSKDEYLNKVLKVVSARAQVVAGVIYTMEVEVGRTQCKKASTVNANSCPLLLTPGLKQTSVCTFAVLEVYWEGIEQLLYSSCKPQ